MFLRLTGIVVCLASATGCGVLSTTTKLPPPPVLQTASRQQLVDTIQRIASIESMRAVIEVRLSVQTDDRQKEISYRDVRGALVTRRPRWIRTNAETPGGIARVYDMVSDGEQFQVYLPWRNRVYVGSTELTEISEQRAENIRPQHILEAIMLAPIQDERMLLLDIEVYGRSGFQVLHEVEPGEDGILRIRRKYWFGRSDLNLSRLMILNEDTELVTDAWYRDWAEENGLVYPQFIQIERPKDGYTIELRILKPGLNEEIPIEAFDLGLPDDVEIERIGQDAASNS